MKGELLHFSIHTKLYAEEIFKSFLLETERGEQSDIICKLKRMPKITPKAANL